MHYIKELVVEGRRRLGLTTTQETEVTIVLTFGLTVHRTARQAVFPVADIKSCRRARRCYFISLKATRVEAEDVATSAARALMRGKHVHPFLL